jgi:hypothetical protein
MKGVSSVQTSAQIGDPSRICCAWGSSDELGTKPTTLIRRYVPPSLSGTRERIRLAVVITHVESGLNLDGDPWPGIDLILQTALS